MAWLGSAWRGQACVVGPAWRHHGTTLHDAGSTAAVACKASGKLTSSSNSPSLVTPLSCSKTAEGQGPGGQPATRLALNQCALPQQVVPGDLPASDTRTGCLGFVTIGLLAAGFPALAAFPSPGKSACLDVAKHACRPLSKHAPHGALLRHLPLHILEGAQRCAALENGLQLAGLAGKGRQPPTRR